MQKTVILLSVAVCLWLNAFSVDVARYRKVFHAAVLDQGKVEEFNTFMRSISPENPITIAYLAVSEAMLADVKWNPLEKYEQVKKYESLILKALQSDPSNLEIRFLRFCVEYHVPSWLGFETHLTEDKTYIVSNLEYAQSLDFDPYFARYIAVFMRDTGVCSVSEVEQIDQMLKSKFFNVVN